MYTREHAKVHKLSLDCIPNLNPFKNDVRFNFQLLNLTVLCGTLIDKKH